MPPPLVKKQSSRSKPKPKQEEKFFVFTDNDPTGDLEEEVTLTLDASGLRVVSPSVDAKVVGPFAWEDVKQWRAVASEDPEEMEIFVFNVESGSFSFEVEDARLIKQACVEWSKHYKRKSRAPFAKMTSGVTEVKAKLLSPHLSIETIADLFHYGETLNLTKGDVVFEQGAAADAMYIVCIGQLVATAGEDEVAILSEGDIFGDQALTQETVDPTRSVGISVASGVARLREIKREDYLTLLTENPELKTALDWHIWDLAEYTREFATRLTHQPMSAYSLVDPTGVLDGDQELRIYCGEIGIAILEVQGEGESMKSKILLSYAWYRIAKLTAQLQAADDPELLELFRFDVANVGTFDFECDDAKAMRAEFEEYKKKSEGCEEKDVGAKVDEAYDANATHDYDLHMSDGEDLGEEILLIEEEGDELSTAQSSTPHWEVFLEQPFGTLVQGEKMVLSFSDSVLMLTDGKTAQLVKSFTWKDIQEIETSLKNEQGRHGARVAELLVKHKLDGMSLMAGSAVVMPLQLRCANQKEQEQLVADLRHVKGLKPNMMVPEPDAKPVPVAEPSDHAKMMKATMTAVKQGRKSLAASQMSLAGKSFRTQHPLDHDAVAEILAEFPESTFRERWDVPHSARVIQVQTINNRDTFVIESSATASGNHTTRQRKRVPQFVEFYEMGLSAADREGLSFPGEFKTKGVKQHMFDAMLGVLIEKAKTKELEEPSIAALLAFIHEGSSVSVGKHEHVKGGGRESVTKMQGQKDKTNQAKLLAAEEKHVEQEVKLMQKVTRHQQVTIQSSDTAPKHSTHALQCTAQLLLAHPLKLTLPPCLSLPLRFLYVAAAPIRVNG
jgi:hypothetical protein